MTMEMELDIGVGLGDIDPSKPSPHEVQLLHNQIALPNLKLNEASYFLRLLKRHINDEAATLYHFNGYVTALRSVLDVLVNQADNPKAASAWAKEKEAQLAKNLDVSRLADLRNKAVHKGMKPPRLVFGLTFKQHHNGDRTLEPSLRLHSVNGAEIPDALGTMERALAALRAVVVEGEARGFVEAHAKPGHVLHVDFQKETAPGQWLSSDPREMEMFGGRIPDFAVVETVRKPDRSDMP